jgi:AcrR family transcriptional regulator
MGCAMPTAANVSDRRRAELIAAARDLLEEEGEAALSMRRLAERLGIRAPSIYKHVPDKATLEAALMAEGLSEAGAALRDAGPELEGVARAYRDWALAHPHLYRLMTDRPLPRERLLVGVEGNAAEPLLRVLGDQDRARAAWAAAHGLVSLELAGRFPADADMEAAWAAMVAAFA